MDSGIMSMVVMFLPLIVIFYFLIIRPQKKEKNKKILMIKNMQIGDKIMTYSGIHGVVKRVSDEETSITVTIAKDVDVVIEKEAVFKNYSQMDREEKAKEEARQEKENSKKK